jgi:hypothetical protein
MSRQTLELLDAFEALPEAEKRIFTAELLRRAIPFDSGPLDDEETAHAADQLLAGLEAEENGTGARLGLAVRPGNGRKGSPCFGRERSLRRP